MEYKKSNKQQNKDSLFVIYIMFVNIIITLNNEFVINTTPKNSKALLQFVIGKNSFQ